MMLLDSGAFTAWTKGEKIDVADYIEFVRRHRDSFDYHVNLDVIPGGGVAPEEAASASYKNLQIMKDAGLRPWPVFHQGERFQWLERMMREPYICLSPTNGLATAARRGWLAECFKIIGSHPIKTHGLGVTSLEIVAAFPWTSVDSSTWARQGGYGKIPIPRCDADRQPDYSLPPLIIGVTDDLPGGIHIDAMPEARLDRVRRHLEESGSSLELARYSHRVRYALWAAYFEKMIAANSGAKFYAATSDSADLQDALSRAGVRHRLASYYWLRDMANEALRRFLEERTPKPKRPASNWRSKSYRAFRALAMHQRGRGMMDVPRQVANANA